MTETQWEVAWGCDEWQGSRAFATEQEARDFFSRVAEARPNLGSHPTTFALLHTPDGDTVASWEQEATE